MCWVWSLVESLRGLTSWNALLCGFPSDENGRVGELRGGANGTKPTCDGEVRSEGCLVQPICAPVGDSSGESKGGGVRTAVSVFGGTDFTGDVIALGRNKETDDFASETICTGLVAVSRSTEVVFLVSLEEEVDSSESLSPLDVVVLDEELEGRAPSVDEGSVTFVRVGGCEAVRVGGCEVVWLVMGDSDCAGVSCVTLGNM